MKNNKLIYSYTLEDLKRIPCLKIKTKLSIRELMNLKYIPDTLVIDISYIQLTDIDLFEETEAYNETNKIIDYLELYKKTNAVKICIKHRDLFEKSKLYNRKINNASLLIYYDFENYYLNDYKRVSKKLNDMTKIINFNDLTLFEKYIAVYNITKQFKEYKEDDFDGFNSRSLKYILDNNYIVCYGFCSLMVALLDKVGINSTIYFTSYVNDKTLKCNYHCKLLTYLNDDKYNVHGYYLCDPTWDNNMKNDYYTHAMLTFDDLLQEQSYMSLNDLDLLFSAHNFSEYNERINYYLNKNNSDYNALYKFIMLNLQLLDPHMYNYFFEKYSRLDKINYQEFLTLFGYYSINSNNHPISQLTIINGSINSKLKLNIISLDDIGNYRKILLDNISRKKKCFPYQIDESKHNLQLKR